MHYFHYKNQELYAEDTAISGLARHVGTPFYVYSTATLVRHARVLFEAFQNLNALIAYSVKSNANLSVLKTLAQEQLGADIVSAGELYRVLKAGFPPERIVFSGVGKTREDLTMALEKKIYQINVESEGELKRLAELACSLKTSAPVCLRVNPDIRAGGHSYIETGAAETKFGIAWQEAERLCHEAHGLKGISFQGIDIHIGSQIESLAPFEKSARKACQLITRLRSQGLPVRRLDLGGGLGIPYRTETPPTPAEYAQSLKRITSGLEVQIILEPGRVISGNAGILITKIIDIKHVGENNFIILDAGMNDLLRPALYGAHHDIWTVNSSPPTESRAEKFKPDPQQANPFYTLAGPICESADIFARDLQFSSIQEGDLMAIMSTGAYGGVMSSEYNGRPLIPEILVKGERWSVTRKRPDYESMLHLESVPDWLL